MTVPHLDLTDRRIINELQGGFPISDEPYKDAARSLGITEENLLNRLKRLDSDGVLSRFGPMYNAEKLGGAVTLCALSAPDGQFDEVAEKVNRRREVAHNYARSHALNMWFVIAVDNPIEIEEVIAGIEEDTGLEVYNFPKQEEFFIGLKVEA
jgi:DNA-binding Lrp family transcriptional regulator